MIERAIENWLINTNERNYQVAFCQVLLQKGHRIIYVSSHRSMEQGKDIITIDKNGDYCAYQLKTGKIDLNTWRELVGEVKEMMELPIVHPSVDKSKVHKSFLVTNGEITDEVRIQIDQINEDNKRKERQYSYLDIITGQMLLKEFIDAQGEFIPKNLNEFNLFLEIFLADGTDFLSKKEYFDFLNSTIFSDIPKQKSDAINAISSSVVITAYSLNSFQTHKNYYGLFEAWTILAACIVRYALRTKLKKEDWQDSINLTVSEIVRNLSLLKEETLQRNDFLEGNLLGDGGFIYRARATITMGALAMLEVHRHQKENYSKDENLLKLVKGNIKLLWFWGESAFPYFLGIIQYLELNNEYQLARSLLQEIFLGIVNENAPRKQIGLPSPYYSVIEVLEVSLGISPNKIDLTQFPGSSYTLESLVLMIARRNNRELLEKNWRKLSYLQFKEFIPDRIEDTFVWHTGTGLNHASFPNATQSWGELVKLAKNISETQGLLTEHADILHFFILVCPHRVNKQIVGLLDKP